MAAGDGGTLLELTEGRVQACRHSADADPEGLIREGRGDTPQACSSGGAAVSTKFIDTGMA